MMNTDDEKKKFLITLVNKMYSQGDNYFATKNKKDNWVFGYTNDYPMQHGSGITITLPDKMVEVLMNEYR